MITSIPKINISQIGFYNIGKYMSNNKTFNPVRNYGISPKKERKAKDELNKVVEYIKSQSSDKCEFFHKDYYKLLDSVKNCVDIKHAKWILTDGILNKGLYVGNNFENNNDELTNKETAIL
jgi:hypothetical protein